MEYRNLRRYILFPRALHKYEKKTQTRIPRNHMIVLVLIAEGYNTRIDIWRALKRIRRMMSYDTVTNAIVQNIASNRITEAQGRYTITTEGILLLRDIETRLRNERYDK